MPFGSSNAVTTPITAVRELPNAAIDAMPRLAAAMDGRPSGAPTGRVIAGGGDPTGVPPAVREPQDAAIDAMPRLAAAMDGRPSGAPTGRVIAGGGDPTGVPPAVREPQDAA